MYLRFTVVGFFLTAAALSLRAEIPVEGIKDKQVVADRVSFRVLPVEGYAYTARLDGVEVPLFNAIDVTQPDYHELFVERTLTSSGVYESTLVRFIVRASERGDSEWGLPPWTPLPVIQSARAEFAGAQLRLVLPNSIPADLQVPVIALIEKENGDPVRVNGKMRAPGFPSFQLKRGVGSTLLPRVGTAQLVSYQANVGGLKANREINVEGATPWTSVSGLVSGVQAWPENARVHVVSNLVLAADATLSIGAGAIVKLGPGVEIQCSGKMTVAGTRDRPVLFTPERPSNPWGGIVLRTNVAELQMTGAILTGSGANPEWFAANPGSGVSHRHEQPLIYVSNGAQAHLSECYLVDNQGQAAHGENGFLTMTNCVVQNCISTGQFNGGAVNLDRSAFLDFPAESPVFADADNDALYFTEGTHRISNSLIGWAKDDAIDAGSGGAGEVTVSGCWIESCFHEGLAWSGTGRIARSKDTVVLNCGQGIETGWNSPDVVADHCLSTGNLIGARFGDNYDWTYEGFLRVTNSFLLFNYRNIWGRQWGDWTERLNRMDLQGNFLSAADFNHPTNRVWTIQDGAQLAPFLSVPPDSAVGVGFATWTRQLSNLTQPIPVGLSRFSTTPVRVRYSAESPRRVWVSGTIEFAPGETVKQLALSAANWRRGEPVQLVLSEPVGAEITGPPLLFLEETPASSTLVARGSDWTYLDTGVEPPAGWRTAAFDDSGWKSGRAELGYGDGDEATVIQGGPAADRFSAAYFRRLIAVSDPAAYGALDLRLRRDDGAVVYLNGTEIFRSNMPTGIVQYATLALSASTSETEFFAQELPTTALVTGSNVIAVEVHQATKTSSDLSFDLELSARSASKLRFQAMPGGTLWLYGWADGAQLEEAAAVTGPWHLADEPASPVRVAGEGTRFYRLRQW